MNEEEKRLQRCCFTGHRPGKMQQTESEIVPLLEKAIDNAIAEGFCTFITGMARGTDIWAARAVLKRRASNPSLRLVCALPHPGFERGRSYDEIAEFKRIVESADFVCTVSKGFSVGCYQIRNKWMVDHSNLVIAVYNGLPSGTGNTVAYAERHGVRVENLLDSKIDTVRRAISEFDKANKK